MELQDNTSGPSYAETGTFGKHLHLHKNTCMARTCY